MSKIKERPIIMTGESVRGILAGRKTQTRRVVNPQPPTLDEIHSLAGTGYSWFQPDFAKGTARFYVAGPVWAVRQLNPGTANDGIVCPFGRVGDRLWVRESWCHSANEDDTPKYNTNGNLDSSCVWYAADGADVIAIDGDGFHEFNKDGSSKNPWKSPLFMPRWASRLTLEIMGVRVERLQAITEGDAIAEGCEPDWDAFAEETNTHEGWIEPEEFIEECEAERDWVNYGNDLVLNPAHAEWERDRNGLATWLAYRKLWDKINGKVHPWESNPFVWVIEFKRPES